MRLVFIIALVLLLTCVCTSKSKKDKAKLENEAENSGGGTWKQAKEFFREIVDIVFDRILNYSVFPAVDIARTLVNGFDSETMVHDLTSADEAIRGMEFDNYDEKHGNRVMKGIKLEDFEEVFRVIAASNDLPEKFVKEVILGKDVESNKAEMKEFYFNVGKKSDVWYCVVNTAKVGDKIDLAMAYYNLKFKLADRERHHTNVKRFLGAPIWTDEWKTTEPRKLSSKDQYLFWNFLQVKAVTGFIKEYHVDDGSTGHLAYDDDEL